MQYTKTYLLLYSRLPKLNPNAVSIVSVVVAELLTNEPFATATAVFEMNIPGGVVLL